MIDANIQTENLQSGSIRTRLLLWLLIPLIFVGIIALVDVYIEARSTADEVSDRVLAGSALAIAERVFVNEEGDLEVDIPYVALQMLTSSEDDRVFYRIEDSNANFITGYRNLELPVFDSANPQVQFGNSRFRGTEVRVAILQSAAASNTKSLGYVVAVAETTNARQAIAQELLVRSGIRVASLIGAAAFLVWIAVSRSLLPLKRLEEAVSRRSPDDVRPILHKVPFEVSGLVVTINALVSRFASSIQALKNFTSNASHQFRTPLAIIKTHLEIAAREKDPQIKGQAILDAQNAVDSAERLMAQMLTLARIDAASQQELAQKSCDLAAITKRVCEDTILQQSNRSKSDVDLGYSGPDHLNIFGDETLIQEVVRNLVDNAIKHGGKNPTIDISVTEREGRAVLEVSDDGPVFALPDKIQNGQKSLSNSAGTNGFGLAIIREILAIYKAEMTLTKKDKSAGKTVGIKFHLH